MRYSGHVVCKKKKRFNAEEETLTTSGRQRHLGGLLCTYKLQKNCMGCGLPKPNCQTACFGYMFQDGVICIWLATRFKKN